MQNRRSGTTLNGFTIIEIMIALATIGVLATVALPRFIVYQLKTKTAEVKTNLGGIRTAQEAYYGEYGTFASANPEPILIPGNVRAQFDAINSDFVSIGWQPEGAVFFSYGIAISPDGTAYTAGADIDANGVVQFWAYAKPASDGTVIVAKVGCDTTVVVPNNVSPCGPAVGQSIF